VFYDPSEHGHEGRIRARFMANKEGGATSI
jgi:hypothetical protein